ncbi:MAG: sporulation protein YqfD, partial [Halanaerobiales bacterium]
FKGLENIEEETILEVLEEAGIRKGILKKDLDLMEIENYLLQRIPAISWADLSWQGTRLTVDLVEKKLVKPVEKGALVASKDGIISKLIVLKGQALVKEGDTVTEGQVLVLPGSDGEARAIIKAEIWYEARAESPLKEQLIINTGKKRTKWGVKLADRLIRFSTTIPPYDQYRLKRSSKKIFAWRNISLPIELFKEEYQEIKILEMNNSAELALFKAKEKALAGILLHIEEGSLIESVYLEVVENEDNNKKIKLRLMIKTEENIACLKEDFSGRN